jgi:hypothetical protein
MWRNICIIMTKITYHDLKDGDQLFQRNNFNHKDINTWMSPIVYFGINMWNWILKRPVCPCNHCGTLYKVDGIWVVREAKQVFKETALVDKLINTDITDLYVKRYDLTAGQKELMRYSSLSLIGVKYDYWSIIKQFVRQLFDKHVDLETNPIKFENKRVNCSEANAIQLQYANIDFNNTKNISPYDLWFDERSTLIGKLK